MEQKNINALSNNIKIEVRNENISKGVIGAPVCVEYDYPNEYTAGDIISITAPEGIKYLMVQTDSNIVESLIYLPDGIMAYTVPTGEKLTAFNPDAFRGTSHIIKARIAKDFEIYAYRNLALNSMDSREQTTYFPHARANFVTMDKPCLEARNAIDGCIENNGHGNYPYHSWGGGKRNDLEFEVIFGRNVETDKIIIYLRADFAKDHDTYWKSIIVKFADGSTIPICLTKTEKPQIFTFTPKKTSLVRLVELEQASLPLGFAALTEIEIYGKEIR